jgi:hypothetical protein
MVAGAVAELRDLAAAVGGLPRTAAIDADLVAAVAAAYRSRPAGPRRATPAPSGATPGYGWAAAPTPPICWLSPAGHRCWTDWSPFGEGE